jgi:2-dehydro-3-deoxygluconokinase
MSPQLVTLGEAMLRLSPPAHGRLQEADSFEIRVAGAEANVAVAMASLGVETAWLSALPDAPLGHRVARALGAAGVDIEHVEWHRGGRVGLFFVEFGADPRPTTVWYDRDNTAFSAMSRVPSAALGGCRMALTSGITLALSSRSRELAHEFLDQARTAGASVCIDVNYRERICSAGDARSSLEPVLADADVVLCSRADAERVFGIADADFALVAQRLRERFAPRSSALVLTDGANGSVGVGATEIWRQAAIETDVVDRVGAGDAYLAGLLWGLLSDAGLERSLSYASALGALKCTVRGDHAMFTPDEVRAAAAPESVALIR